MWESLAHGVDRISNPVKLIASALGLGGFFGALGRVEAGLEHEVRHMDRALALGNLALRIFRRFLPRISGMPAPAARAAARPTRTVRALRRICSAIPVIRTRRSASSFMSSPTTFICAAWCAWIRRSTDV